MSLSISNISIRQMQFTSMAEEVFRNLDGSSSVESCQPLTCARVLRNFLEVRDRVIEAVNCSKVFNSRDAVYFQSRSKWLWSIGRKIIRILEGDDFDKIWKKYRAIVFTDDQKSIAGDLLPLFQYDAEGFDSDSERPELTESFLNEVKVEIRKQRNGLNLHNECQAVSCKPIDEERVLNLGEEVAVLKSPSDSDDAPDLKEDEDPIESNNRDQAFDVEAHPENVQERDSVYDILLAGITPGQKLLNAILSNQAMAAVEELLKDPSITDEDRGMALMIAIHNQNWNVVIQLLDFSDCKITRSFRSESLLIFIKQCVVNPEGVLSDLEWQILELLLPANERIGSEQLSEMIAIVDAKNHPDLKNILEEYLLMVSSLSRSSTAAAGLSSGNSPEFSPQSLSPRQSKEGPKCEEGVHNCSCCCHM